MSATSYDLNSDFSTVLYSTSYVLSSWVPFLRVNLTLEVPVFADAVAKAISSSPTVLSTFAVNAL